MAGRSRRGSGTPAPAEEAAGERWQPGRRELGRDLNDAENREFAACMTTASSAMPLANGWSAASIWRRPGSATSNADHTGLLERAGARDPGSVATPGWNWLSDGTADTRKLLRAAGPFGRAHPCQPAHLIPADLLIEQTGADPRAGAKGPLAPVPVSRPGSWRTLPGSGTEGTRETPASTRSASGVTCRVRAVLSSLIVVSSSAKTAVKITAR